MKKILNHMRRIITNATEDMGSESFTSFAILWPLLIIVFIIAIPIFIWLYIGSLMLLLSRKLINLLLPKRRRDEKILAEGLNKTIEEVEKHIDVFKRLAEK